MTSSLQEYPSFLEEQLFSKALLFSPFSKLASSWGQAFS
jgi:hypothetical protein